MVPEWLINLLAAAGIVIGTGAGPLFLSHTLGAWLSEIGGSD